MAGDLKYWHGMSQLVTRVTACHALSRIVKSGHSLAHVSYRQALKVGQGIVVQKMEQERRVCWLPLALTKGDEA